MTKITGTGFSDGVFLTDPLPDTETTISFKPVEYNIQIPADIAFYAINGKVIAKLDYATEYTGRSLTIEESGVKYKTKFEQSTYTDPIELTEV